MSSNYSNFNYLKSFTGNSLPTPPRPKNIPDTNTTIALPTIKSSDIINIPITPPVNPLQKILVEENTPLSPQTIVQTYIIETIQSANKDMPLDVITTASTVIQQTLTNNRELHISELPQLLKNIARDFNITIPQTFFATDYLQGKMKLGTFTIDYFLKNISEPQVTPERLSTQAENATLKATNTNGTDITGVMNKIAIEKTTTQTTIIAETAEISAYSGSATILSQSQDVVMVNQDTGAGEIETKQTTFTYKDRGLTTTGTFNESTSDFDELGNQHSVITGLNMVSTNKELTMTTVAQTVSIDNQRETLSGSAVNILAQGNVTQDDLTTDFTADLATASFTKNAAGTAGQTEFRSIQTKGTISDTAITTQLETGNIIFDEAQQTAALTAEDAAVSAQNNVLTLNATGENLNLNKQQDTLSGSAINILAQGNVTQDELTTDFTADLATASFTKNTAGTAGQTKFRSIQTKGTISDTAITTQLETGNITFDEAQQTAALTASTAAVSAQNDILTLNATGENLNLNKQQDTLSGSAINILAQGNVTQDELTTDFTADIATASFVKNSNGTVGQAEFRSLQTQGTFNDAAIMTELTDGTIHFDEAQQTASLTAANATGSFQNDSLNVTTMSKNLSLNKQQDNTTMGSVTELTIQGNYLATSFSLIAQNTDFAFNTNTNTYGFNTSHATLGVSSTLGSNTINFSGLFDTLSVRSVQNILTGNINAHNISLNVANPAAPTMQFTAEAISGDIANLNTQTFQSGTGNLNIDKAALAIGTDTVTIGKIATNFDINNQTLDLQLQQLNTNWQDFKLSLDTLNIAYTEALSTATINKVTLGYQKQQGYIENIRFTLTQESLTVKFFDTCTLSFTRPQTAAEGEDILNELQKIIFEDDGSINKTFQLNIPNLSKFSDDITSISFLPYIPALRDISKNFNFGLTLDSSHLEKIIAIPDKPFTGLTALNEACAGNIAPLTNKAICSYLDYAATQRKTMTGNNELQPTYQGISSPMVKTGLSARMGITTTADQSVFGVISAQSAIASLSLGASYAQNPQPALTIGELSFTPTTNLYANATLGPELLHLNIDSSFTQGVFRLGNHAARSLFTLGKTYGLLLDENDPKLALLKSEWVPFISASLETKVQFSKSFSLTLAYTPYPEMLFVGTGDSNPLSEFSFLSSGKIETGIDLQLNTQTSFFGSAQLSKEKLSIEGGVRTGNMLLGASYTQAKENNTIGLFGKLSL